MDDQTDNKQVSRFFADICDEGFHSLCYAKPPDRQFRVAGFASSHYELTDWFQNGANFDDYWFGVYPMHQVERGRGTVADVNTAQITHIAGDFDYSNDAHHSADGLHSQGVVLHHLVQTRPAWIVHTGGGYHAYWRLDPDVPWTQIRTYAFWRYLREEHGLNNERKDLASVLRVPGSYNHKTDPPKLVEIVLEDPTAALRLDVFAEQYPAPSGPTGPVHTGDGNRATPQSLLIADAQSVLRKMAWRLENQDQIRNQGRNNALFELACELDRLEAAGLDADVAKVTFSALIEVCRNAGLSDREISATIRSARGRA